MSNLIRIATRQSLLAQVQANKVKALLLASDPNLSVELVYFSTTGDEVLDRPLAEIGGKALFIKTLEEGLLQDKADIAVHSLKDVPSVLAEDFSLLAYLERENPADIFLSRDFSNFADLPLGASVGTSSPRRSAQLLNWRPDLKIKMLRGNVPTRIQKIMNAEFDAGILAYAGVKRLDLTSHIKQIFPLDFLMPSPGQGVIAVECLASQQKKFEFLREILNDFESEKVALAERSFAAALGGDCYSPIAALGEINAEGLMLKGVVFSADGSQKVSGEKTLFRSGLDLNLNLNLKSELKFYENCGALLAQELLSRGAGELLKCHSNH